MIKFLKKLFKNKGLKSSEVVVFYYDEITNTIDIKPKWERPRDAKGRFMKVKK